VQVRLQLQEVVEDILGRLQHTNGWSTLSVCLYAAVSSVEEMRDQGPTSQVILRRILRHHLKIIFSYLELPPVEAVVC